MCAVRTVEVFQRASILEPLGEQYRRHFVDGATAVGDNFTFEQPDAVADAVWKRIILPGMEQQRRERGGDLAESNALHARWSPAVARKGLFRRHLVVLLQGQARQRPGLQAISDRRCGASSRG